MSRLRDGATFGVGHDVVAALTREAAVAFVAGEDQPGTVRLADRAGEALVVHEGHRERIRYEPLTGDPLELSGPRALSPSDWLEATWNGPYPDACVQLLDQFRAPRTGDLVVVAREGFDFRRRFEIPEHKAGHGSLIQAHMQVPIWTSVPAPAGVLRTVDLFPAMLDWLGEPVPAGIDGQLSWSPGTATVA
jgi:hypothetical protein